jgi:hypothetical protein
MSHEDQTVVVRVQHPAGQLLARDGLSLQVMGAMMP